jgi:hypothetical protein
MTQKNERPFRRTCISETAALINARGKRLGSRLPFFFKCFHLLSAVAHNSIATLAQAQTGQAGASRDPINAGA